MTWWVKVLAAKTNNLSSILGLTVQGKKGIVARQGEASSAGLEPLVSLRAGQQAAGRWEGQGSGIGI